MRDFAKVDLKAAITGLAVATALAVTSSTAFAQRVPSEGEILNALKPRATRALSSGDPQRNAAEQRAINDIRAVRTRSLTSQEREQVAAIAKTKPSIDLEIYFDYNSAAISPRAVASLTTLGRALTDPQLRGSVFLVGGHTDARGGEEYNLGLSERRAQAVKDYLVQKFRITDDTLVVAGFGEEQLKNKAVPYAAQNRRVQISNLQSQQEANR